MRESKRGYAVLAPSDASIDNLLGSEGLRMLEAASCGDPPELIGLVSKMAAYHVVPAPATSEVMCVFGVVATRAGELPVEACGDGGGNDVGTATMYVNGA